MAPRNKPGGRSSPHKLSRAKALLEKLAATHWFDQKSIAEALVVTEATLDDFLTGEAPIPLDRQLCLALFVIENVPALARSGHQLRNQVAAAIAFQERRMDVHEQAPSIVRTAIR